MEYSGNINTQRRGLQKEKMALIRQIGKLRKEIIDGPTTATTGKSLEQQLMEAQDRFREVQEQIRALQPVNPVKLVKPTKPKSTDRLGSGMRVNTTATTAVPVETTTPTTTAVPFEATVTPKTILPKEFFIEKARREKIERGIQEVDAWPEDISTYLYFGHGSDKCDAQGEPIEAIVPNGCIYVTITECGLTTRHSQKKINTMLSKSQDINTILRYIYYPDLTKKLANLLGLNPEHIRVKLPGTKYIVSSFYPFHYWNNKEYFLLAHSGLVDRNRFIKNNYPIENEYFIWKFDLSEINAIPKDSSLNKNSFFDILRNISIHLKSPLRRKIQHIQEMVNKKMNDPEFNLFIEKKFPGKEIFDYKDMETIIDKYILTIPRSLFLDFFNGSVIPSKIDVETNLRQIKTSNNLSIGKINKFEKEYISTKLQTNQVLMNTFPGIHFNIVCRSVSEECAKKVETQRARSVERNRLRRNITQKRFPTLNAVLQDIQNYNSKNTISFERLVYKLKVLQASNPDIFKDESLIHSLLSLTDRQHITSEQFNSLFFILNPPEDMTSFANNFSHSIEVLLVKQLKNPSSNKYESIIFNLLHQYIQKLQLYNIPIENKIKWYDAIKKFLIELQSIIYYTRYSNQINNLINELPNKVFTAEELAAQEAEAKRIKEEKEAEAKRIADEAATQAAFLKRKQESAPIKQKLSSIIERYYKSFHDRQIAIYNVLLSMKQTLATISDPSKEEVIQFLQDEGIFKGTTPIVKKIRHAIHPTKYQLGGRRTRKLRLKTKSKSKTKSRKH